MKATIRIRNKTRYRSDQLRAFVARARDQVFEKDERKPLTVFFERSRTRIHGRAALGGSRSRIWLPRREACDVEFKLQLAQILCHELAHNAGAQGERWMRRSTRYGWGEGWRLNVTWAEWLPLELAPVAKRPLAPTIEARRAAIELRIQRWTTKEKRARTALRKLRRSLTYYDKKLAASRPA